MLQTIIVFLIMAIIVLIIGRKLYRALKINSVEENSNCISCTQDCKMKEYIRRKEPKNAEKRTFSKKSCCK